MVEAFGRAELIVATRPNGIAVSPEGRILAVAEGGLRWLGSDGALAPFYEDAPTNCCFGGEALGTLFVTDWNGGGRVLAWGNLPARGFAPPAYRD
jgi:sugar lactone lactonase YvrE